VLYLPPDRDETLALNAKPSVVFSVYWSGTSPLVTISE
jgi:hypothetical protein